MKLHIGGQTTKEGWKILNIQKKDGVDFVGDLTDLSQFSANFPDITENLRNLRLIIKILQKIEFGAVRK